MDLHKKIIVVTGGAGFIGSNLCIYLINQSPNNLVVCVDNMITGSRDNLRELLVPHHPRFTLIEHDVCMNADQALFGEDRIDEIYHLASIASPRVSCLFPKNTG